MKTLGLLLPFSLALTLGACKPKAKKASGGDACQQGCDYRVSCIEELAVSKAVTAANREALRRSQVQTHRGFADFCAKRCRKAQPRFEAYSRCGRDSKSCQAYFACESAALKNITSPPTRVPPPK